jgi:hypothetical protein
MLPNGRSCPISPEMGVAGPVGGVRLPLADPGLQRFVKVLHTRLPIREAGSGSHTPLTYSRVQGWWVTGRLRLPGLPLARYRHACDSDLRQQCWWSGGHTFGYGCRGLQPKRSVHLNKSQPQRNHKTRAPARAPTPCKHPLSTRQQRSHPPDRDSGGKSEQSARLATAVG